MKVLIKREVGEVKDTRRIKREEVERGEETEAERELWWPGEEMRREAEETGWPRGQEWRTGLATIGEGLLPGERGKLSGSKNEALELLTPLQKSSPSLRNLGTEDKEDTGRQIRQYTRRRALTENSIIMSSWHWKSKVIFF